MKGEIVDEIWKRFIKRRAIKDGCRDRQCLVSYFGRLFYVNFDKDLVVLQSEYK